MSQSGDERPVIKLVRAEDGVCSGKHEKHTFTDFFCIDGAFSVVIILVFL